MDHATAVKLNIPERYILGDLSADERDSFEDHFAGCTACMDEVWTASAFAANARAVFRERAQRPVEAPPVSIWSRLRWQIAVPVFASLALASVAIYQTAVTIPGLRAPQAALPAVALEGVTRSAPPALPPGKPLHFEIALSAAPPTARVWVELLGASGQAQSKGWVDGPAADQPLDVYFPLKLAAGFYTVVVRASESGAELARGRFQVVAPEKRTS